MEWGRNRIFVRNLVASLSNQFEYFANVVDLFVRKFVLDGLTEGLLLRNLSLLFLHACHLHLLRYLSGALRSFIVLPLLLLLLLHKVALRVLARHLRRLGVSRVDLIGMELTLVIDH